MKGVEKIEFLFMLVIFYNEFINLMKMLYFISSLENLLFSIPEFVQKLELYCCRAPS